MAKPRIRFRRGIWSCVLIGPPQTTGYGYTPAEAYREWLSEFLDLQRRGALL